MPIAYIAKHLQAGYVVGCRTRETSLSEGVFPKVAVGVHSRSDAGAPCSGPTHSKILLETASS